MMSSRTFRNSFYFFLIILVFFHTVYAGSTRIRGMQLGGSDMVKTGQCRCGIRQEKISRNDPTKIFIAITSGSMNITSLATTETYEVYFHIPVSFAEQVPILITVDSPYLVDYRFLRLSPPNLIVAARMLPGQPTYLDWTTWVMVIENNYDDLPIDVAIPDIEDLPDSVTCWLTATDCAQLASPIVQQAAAEVRNSATNLNELADNICDYCHDIPWSFSHSPISFDAVYTLNWGNSCTGHAHAGAALFRANGIPARTLLNMPTWGGSGYDMHWVIDYFVPDYGWVRMETSIGLHPYSVDEEIVTLVCNPEDEFPLFLPCAIEGQWHTSDPAMGMLNPDWEGAHSSGSVCSITGSTESILQAHALAHTVFNYYTDCWGIPLTPVQAEARVAAYEEQSYALASAQGSDLTGFITHMESARGWYESIELPDTITVFHDDCEGMVNAWNHGGEQDEWELGAPVLGPVAAHSGTYCWGTDLDGNYENNTDCWVLSPWIDLTALRCAYLGFWVWNWVEDITQGAVYDPLWLEITPDGENYLPLSSCMGGVNDDPEIPDVGGWSYVVIDLTKYAGGRIRVRFRFSSNGSITQFGSYIDDIHVYGRIGDESGITEDLAIVNGLFLLDPVPNPTMGKTTVEFILPDRMRVCLDILDISGRRVVSLLDGTVMSAGHHAAIWEGYDERGYRVPAGLYLCRLVTDRGSRTRRVVVVD